MGTDWSSAASASGTRCLVDDDAAAFVAGQLSPEQRGEIATHLDVCDSCRRLVSALMAAAIGSRGEPGRAESDTGLRAGQVLGRFSLTRLLGHGSMGEVWAAYDRELDREVALKLLRLPPGALGTEAAIRLRREAQAMARLSHPNVVAIYELGSDEAGRAFCAMELVAGMTLRRWLEAPRSWRNVLGVATAVARGIAAAHGVGLIHRDIKPENVLISSGGRVVVSDFGLARLADLGAGTDEPSGTDAAPAARSPIGALTATGAVIGTPLYMAPEQLAGSRADARSDQFSYCVTIYEALFGARPFSGGTLAELEQCIRRGPPRPPRRRGIPGGVVRCLVRGLAADPATRWPSMAALGDELERAARRPHQRRLTALGAGAAVAGGAIALWIARGPDPFAAARVAGEQRMAAVWNPGTAAVLQARFLATGSRLAGERATTTVKLLDAYRAAWTAHRLDAWSATHRRDEQTPDVLERRLACLDQLADAMDGLVALFLAPEPRDVDQAPQSVYRLEPIATCGNIDRLMARSVAPSTPAGAEAERQLRELRAAQTAGRHAEVLQRANALVEAATRRGDPSALARARFDLGSAQANAGHLVEAEANLRRAVQDAAAMRDHYLIAECWIRLLTLTGLELQHADEAAAIEPAVRAAVAQAGNDPRQLADLAKTLGLAAAARGDFATAHARFLEARDRRIAARGANDPSVANDESNLGAVLVDLGQEAEGAEHLERAAALMRATLGEHHPTIAQIEHNLGTVASHRRDWAAAVRHAQAAIAMNVAVRGADHPDTARNRVNLARILRRAGRFADARAELARAHDIIARALPPGHPDAVLFDINVAEIDAAEGHWDEAVARARSVADAARRSNLPAVWRAEAVLKHASLVAHNTPADALALYEEGLGLLVEVKGRAPSGDIEKLRELAEVAVRAHQPAVAIRWFDRMPDAARGLADVRRGLDAAPR